MKKTGVTRRIDELGRIVIPKEIRKNLKIRDSDELEIYVQDDSIILNKFASISRDNVIEYLLFSLAKYSNKNVILTSKDTIIDYYNSVKVTYSDLNLSNGIIKMIESRKVSKSYERSKLCLTDKDLFVSYIIHPILINGDLLGSLIVYSDNLVINNIDECMVEFCVTFLEKYLE